MIEWSAATPYQEMTESQHLAKSGYNGSEKLIGPAWLSHDQLGIVADEMRKIFVRSPSVLEHDSNDLCSLDRQMSAGVKF